MTEDTLKKLLITKCREAGGQSAWARENGATKSKVSEFLTGKRPAVPSILRGLGVVRVVTYIRRPQL